MMWMLCGAIFVVLSWCVGADFASPNFRFEIFRTSRQFRCSGIRLRFVCKCIGVFSTYSTGAVKRMLLSCFQFVSGTVTITGTANKQVL